MAVTPSTRRTCGAPSGDLLGVEATGGHPGAVAHTDRLGSVTALSDGGDVAGRLDYSSFGTVDDRDVTGTAGNVALGFTGELHDDERGLVHLRLRDYQPEIGQFTALDPAPAAAGEPYHTPYHYAYNQPTNLTDPSGACPLCAAAGAAVGGLVGGGVEAGRQLFSEDRSLGELDWGSIGAEAAGGAVAGGLMGLAGPAGGAIAGGLGASSAGGVATGMSLGITGAAGGIGTQTSSVLRGDGFASVTDTAIGAGTALAGRGVGSLATRTRFVPEFRSMHTISQSRHFGPQQFSRYFDHPGHNYTALRRQNMVSASWVMFQGVGDISVEHYMTGK
ncbi:RHS repeat-associated core domain-containing protein [Egibacter rhizosphaerae]|uniref:RHS repeat-associated core domain-containing protein n=1 Tax=Egibacter rhizosphaerae TaxID=1670831 RepID=A0A411YC33_9ACTN|nr:RHS repeat-associated core domain-containing protein [Egibacter rhizosphaerae]QBI18735.1 RHS repeat-associated core domain-containing protein [Egibacter rhizosphaerae]